MQSIKCQLGCSAIWGKTDHKDGRIGMARVCRVNCPPTCNSGIKTEFDVVETVGTNCPSLSGRTTGAVLQVNERAEAKLDKRVGLGRKKSQLASLGSC
jgi:hypothetical protein